MGALAAVEPWFARLARAQETGAAPKRESHRGGRVHVVPSTKETVQLGVYDAKTNTMIQHIPTWTGSHSIQTNLKNNHVYLPTRGNSGPCKGCILVFAPE